MDEAKFRDAVEALFAYDTGAVDSGIHDETLRAECITHLNSLTDDEGRALLARTARTLYLTDEAIAAGYGLEDVTEFGRWVYDDDLGRLA